MKVDWKVIYTVGAFYVIATSGLYLFGYGRVFNINIMPYMDVSEIVRFSIYPILITV